MAMYLIGDLQGCDSALQRLLNKLDFSPSRDTIYLLGDLVNRGPESLAVLRRLMALGDAARSILGNHDLHLLAVSQGVRRPHPSDTLDGILQAPDRTDLLDWLRQQPLARLEQVGSTPLLMVHAGVLPNWNAAQTVALASEVSSLLAGKDGMELLQHMYGNLPDQWDSALAGADRWRVIVNALTRMRFCSADGVMEFKAKMGADAAPAGYMPWFEVPGRATRDVAVAFGHWSTLGWLGKPNLFALDSGCVWGGCLTALRCWSEDGTLHTEKIDVQCEGAATPGAD